MKRPITLMLAIMATFTLSAQTMNVHFKNGQKIEFSSDIVDYVDFTEKPAPPTLTEGAYVDLGLSVKWATCNVGAKEPYESGLKFSWGETATKQSFEREDYAFYNPIDGGYTDIGEDISGTQFDAATAHLGKDWRMPTRVEFEELRSRCIWEWRELNGVLGYVVKGPNGNKIFLPLVLINKYTKTAYYWSSNQLFTHCSYILAFNRNESGYLFNQSKHLPCFIRPVYSPSASDGISNIKDYITIARKGISSSVTSNGTIYKVTFEIANTSNESIELVSLGGVYINKRLEGNNTFSITLQNPTTALQNNQQELVFKYNGKTYTVKG